MTKTQTTAAHRQARPQEIADDALDIGGAGIGRDLNLGNYTGSAEVEGATGPVHQPLDTGWDILKQPEP